jgi:glycine/D-amino acid oxidase-like deaminating enzyme
MEAIVVGAGIMGLSAAWALMRRGHRVTVFEQGPIPNPLGSSVDQHRLIRHPYGSMLGYTRMIDPAFEAWELLWRDLGERLYAETGTLALDSGAGSWADRSAATMTEAGIPFARLATDEIARRWPMLALDGIEGGLHLTTGGVLFAGRIVELLAHHLGLRGVRLRANSRVASVDPDSATVEPLGEPPIRADVVVVAAGPWIARLLPAMHKRVTPSRQVVAYVHPPHALAPLWAKAPMLLHIGSDDGVYIVPPVAGHGMKLGDHRFTLSGDPDRDRAAEADELRAVLGAARNRLRDYALYHLDYGRTCFYTVEPAERFIVEPIGRAGWVMTGFSGHGFKFGALMGLRLAAAIAGEIEAATLARYAAGDGEEKDRE